MKKINYIAVFFASALILLSCGRASNMEEKMMCEDSASMPESFLNKTEMDFLTDTLNSQQKELFGKRAIQKLEDYYNYVEIISNKNYDAALRDHAKTLASELFLDKKNTGLILDSISSTPSDSSAVSINNIAIKSIPKMINDSLYKGSLMFEEKVHNKIQARYTGFIIKKVTKNFGQEQSLVWETYLDFSK